MKKMSIKDFRKIKYLWLIVILHFIIGVYFSRGVFGAVFVDAGFENSAYSMYITGESLNKDILSRALCYVYSHFFALAIIATFWTYILSIFQKIKTGQKQYWIVLFLFFIAFIFSLIYYPYSMKGVDVSYNMVYALEFLPMYWHGFFTNVYFCAAIIFFPSLISIPTLQIILAIALSFSLFTRLLSIFSIDSIQQFLLFLFALFFAVIGIPEIYQIFILAGRNTMYGILTAYLLGTILIDYYVNEKLNSIKYVQLTILFVLVGLWRGEGICYLASMPIMICLAYRLNPKNLFHNKNRIFKAVLCFLSLLILLALPDKYGNEKYQWSDYKIINTYGSLAAVLNSDEYVTYDGLESDLSNIDQVVPLKYITSGGETGGLVWNWQNGRLSRQCGVSKQAGETYLRSAYKFLLHNWRIYFKYQINNALESLDAPSWVKRFNVPAPSGEALPPISAKNKEFSAKVMSYYTIGSSVIDTYAIDYFNKYRENINARLELLYRFLRESAFLSKLFMLALGFVIFIYSLSQKRWLVSFIYLFITGLLCIIILAAPAIRANYYYSVFYNIYWYILISSLCIGNKCSNTKT